FGGSFFTIGFIGAFIVTRDFGSFSPFFATTGTGIGLAGCGAASGFLATGFSAGLASFLITTCLAGAGLFSFLGSAFFAAGLAAGSPPEGRAGFAAGFAAFLGAGFLAAGFFLVAIQLAFF